ncbi:MAG: hypothetical protein JWR38_5302 [Mucilaginibacter sp.]|nr:hypothetical protein [Mucilaginibacter sp.]
MTKIFGYSKRGGQDWFDTDPYGDKEIEQISDPEGGSGTSLPTAIPTPFARMDLTKTAFKNISRTPELRSYTAHKDIIASRENEKQVSDALDLAEILFNIDNLAGRVSLLRWDRDLELSKLRNGLDEHRRFAETLDLYLSEDSDAFNFDLMPSLYLVICNHRIIGCTSPVTMFFATGNDLSHAAINLAGNAVSFSGTFAPLYTRDEDFQFYLYALFRANPVLVSRMRYLHDYLVQNLEILGQRNPSLYNRIMRQTLATLTDEYQELDTGVNGATVEVLGVALRKRKTESILDAVSRSDFRISSAKFRGQKPPLVLQNNLTKSGFRYVQDPWDTKKVIPFLDPLPLEQRWLPSLSIQYPYLTYSDLLEPQLIRLIYPINKDKFFDGNTRVEAGDDSKSYLLPLKPAFFDYFDAGDLVDQYPGKPKIEMIQGASASVKVVLKIPVQKAGEYITFERTYYSPSEGTTMDARPETNKGAIVEHQIGLTIFPFIKIGDPAIDASYRIQMIDRDVFGLQKNAQFELKFFTDKIQAAVQETALRKRRTKGVDTASSVYYVLDEEFDYIRVRNLAGDGASGFIIPKWTIYEPGNEVFEFAVDFGTTNTHIEFKNSEEGPKPFDIKASESQIATLFHPGRLDAINRYSADDLYQLIDYEFVPKLIGNDSEYAFPQRTVLAENRSLNIDAMDTFTLADLNIPFVYEKKVDMDRIQSNLKWAKKESGNVQRVHAYLENLIMLMRNKVLFGKGKLSQTRLTWFYPSSMTEGRRGQLENEWRELFYKYFSHEATLVSMTESLAPYYYFKENNQLKGASKPVVSIDIGGGTTDIVVFRNNKPLLLTSFKFAANTLFGDAYSEYGAASSNQLINKYFAHYKKLLENNSKFDLAKVLHSIKEKNRSEDINAFLFSIADNRAKSNSRLYSYNNLLSHDEDIKVVFIYFYSAIIYHIAKLMRYKAIGLPKNLIFSGTGSKILSIITPNTKALERLSELIFEQVFEERFDEDGFRVIMEKDHPKEVTCKGGLMINRAADAVNPESIKVIYTCLEDQAEPVLTYELLDDATKNRIVHEVKVFNEFFLKLDTLFSFKTNFNVSPAGMETFTSEFGKHIYDFLEEGLEYNRKMNGIATGEIEESLFFYPLIGTINSLLSELSAIIQ